MSYDKSYDLFMKNIIVTSAGERKGRTIGLKYMA